MVFESICSIYTYVYVLYNYIYTLIQYIYCTVGYRSDGLGLKLHKCTVIKEQSADCKLILNYCSRSFVVCTFSLNILFFS